MHYISSDRLKHHLDSLKHWGLDKMADILHTAFCWDFPVHFFYSSCSFGSNWPIANIGAGNEWFGIEQVIRHYLSNDDPFVSLGPNELIHIPLLRHIGIYASMHWVSTGSDNGLSPVRHEAITWTNAVLLLIRPLGINFSEIWTKIHLKISSAKWRSLLSRERWVNNGTT